MAELHPQIVHVTIVLALVGVAFRVLSLVARVTFAGPAAAVLLIAAAASSPEGNCILFGRKATLQADAYEAAGQKDQAIAVLAKTVAAFPNPRLQQSLEGSREAPRADSYRTTRRGTRAFTAS